jgi:hypothetical protein
MASAGGQERTDSRRIVGRCDSSCQRAVGPRAEPSKRPDRTGKAITEQWRPAIGLADLSLKVVATIGRIAARNEENVATVPELGQISHEPPPLHDCRDRHPTSGTVSRYVWTLSLQTSPLSAHTVLPGGNREQMKFPAAHCDGSPTPCTTASRCRPRESALPRFSSGPTCRTPAGTPGNLSRLRPRCAPAPLPPAGGRLGTRREMPGGDPDPGGVCWAPFAPTTPTCSAVGEPCAGASPGILIEDVLGSKSH